MANNKGRDHAAQGCAGEKFSMLSGRFRPAYGEKRERKRRKKKEKRKKKERKKKEKSQKIPKVGCAAPDSPQKTHFLRRRRSRMLENAQNLGLIDCASLHSLRRSHALPTTARASKPSLAATGAGPPPAACLPLSGFGALGLAPPTAPRPVAWHAWPASKGSR